MELAEEQFHHANDNRMPAYTRRGYVDGRSTGGEGSQSKQGN